MQIGTALSSKQAQRICPGCGAASSIAADELSWPTSFVCGQCLFSAPVINEIALTAPALADTVSGFDPQDFQYLAEAELSHFWFVARRRLIVSLAGKYAPSARSFIEVGCGSGNVVKALAESRRWDRILATEIHPSGLAFARSRMPADVEFLQADGRNLPFDSTFDLAGAFDVLEHIAEDEAVLAGINRVLAPGGTLIATVPQHPFLWGPADEVAHHERRYRRGELEAKLRTAGFDIVFSTSYTAILLPLMILSRLLAKRNASGGDMRAIARKEFEISKALNGLLKRTLSLEVTLTERGLRWPVGGSRVVVARKVEGK
ncbi:MULTISPECIES: class I SAM-dependent methyltransferase [unclassified Rhizobium]|uniref:class I SAM-dependent methyltransferase n=1 Tax=unclassified Rhizobium TaxID=2613769 RepID=UPI0007F07585|nr:MULTISPECIES: class I SAM-dependent methyltransferase [unclassified Rhizobium]ANK88031.1 SAM-dependent methyltransferase protein [Rhizobium sp. N731]ANL18277.1 SAM-dependent methyltransferase protein [Rhizobium sp. N1314]